MPEAVRVRKQRPSCKPLHFGASINRPNPFGGRTYCCTGHGSQEMHCTLVDPLDGQDADHRRALSVQSATPTVARGKVAEVSRNGAAEKSAKSSTGASRRLAGLRSEFPCPLVPMGRNGRPAPQVCSIPFRSTMNSSFLASLAESAVAVNATRGPLEQPGCHEWRTRKAERGPGGERLSDVDGSGLSGDSARTALIFRE